MARRKDLRSKLKASARRRSRRSSPNVSGEPPESPAAAPGASTSSGPAVDSQPSADVVGLMVEAILEGEGFDDAAAVSALRGCLKQVAPANDAAAALYRKFDSIAARPDVSARRFRDATNQLIGIASEHRADRRSPNAFLEYLALLVS